MGRKQKRKPFPLKAVLLYVSLCTFVIVGVTFSKYIVASDGGDSARVVSSMKSQFPKRAIS